MGSILDAPLIFSIDSSTQIPLLGAIHFGIVDRGTNLLQIRPTTLCNMNCVFCSTDAGPFSNTHLKHTLVDPSYLLSWVSRVCSFKGDGLIAHIDGVGDPGTYPWLFELISGISSLNSFEEVALQTNGNMLSEPQISRLAQAGLSKIHLSIHGLDTPQTKYLMGMPGYDISRILRLCEHIVSSGISLWLNPVYLPGINEKGVEDVLIFARRIGASVGLQRYNIHRYGRKASCKPQSLWKFRQQLRQWECRFSLRLLHAPHDTGIVRRPSFPIVFQRGEKVYANIVGPGWFSRQMIGVCRNRAITIENCSNVIGDLVRVKITSTKHGIYLAELS